MIVSHADIWVKATCLSVGALQIDVRVRVATFQEAGTAVRLLKVQKLSESSNAAQDPNKVEKKVGLACFFTQTQPLTPIMGVAKPTWQPW